MGVVSYSEWLMEESHVVAVEEEMRRIRALSMGDGEGNGRRRYSAIGENGIGYINLSGPIFPKPNLYTEFLDATALSDFMGEFRELQSDSSVKGTIILCDSPGGVVTGVDEAQEEIFRSRAPGKPIYTHVSGMCCSAAFWIASASDAIFASPSSLVGSVGVVLYARKDDEKGEVTIRSSGAPKKNLSPSSKAGKDALQEWVDGIEGVFVDNLARNRGVSSDVVRENYGQGATLLSAKAYESNMIDGVGYLGDTELLAGMVSLR